MDIVKQRQSFFTSTKECHRSSFAKNVSFPSFVMCTIRLAKYMIPAHNLHISYNQFSPNMQCVSILLILTGWLFGGLYNCCICRYL